MTKLKTKHKDMIWATIGEAGMVLVAAAIGCAGHQPLIFASLGPTIYEQVEQPKLRSARPYNIITGHLIALGSGFFGIWAVGAWSAPHVMSAGFVSPPRLWAATIACAVATVLVLAAKASQPAALATALLVSLGSMQTGRDAGMIVAGVVLVTLLGQPIRHMRLRSGEMRDPVMKHPPYPEEPAS